MTDFVGPVEVSPIRGDRFYPMTESQFDPAVARPPAGAIRIDGCVMDDEAIVRLAHEKGAAGCTYDRKEHYWRWGRTTLEYLADLGYRIEKHIGAGRWIRIQRMTQEEIKKLGCAAALLI